MATAKPNHWLIKSEPSEYAYARLEEDGRTAWTGIRNFEARNNLRAMKRGDLCLYYHSGADKAVVGVAKVVSEAEPDPTAKGEDWSKVDVAPVKRLKEPVTLQAIKATAALADFQLVTRSRLSVVPVSPAQFKTVLGLGKTKL